MQDNSEVIYFSARQPVVQKQGKKTKIVGLAAPFYDPTNAAGTEYKVPNENLYIRLASTAFDRAIREGHRPALLIEHDKTQLAGRMH